jgi:hypothetical protein
MIQRSFSGHWFFSHVTPQRSWPHESPSRENYAGSLFLCCGNSRRGRSMGEPSTPTGRCRQGDQSNSGQGILYRGDLLLHFPVAVQLG